VNKERGPVNANNRERARLWRKKERGPGSGNNEERATLWDQRERAELWNN